MLPAASLLSESGNGPKTLVLVGVEVLTFTARVNPAIVHALKCGVFQVFTFRISGTIIQRTTGSCDIYMEVP
jgi:hypothetical protein